MADQEGAGSAKLAGRVSATLALKKLYKLRTLMYKDPPPFPAQPKYPLTHLWDLQKEKKKKRAIQVLAFLAKDDAVLSFLQQAAVFLSWQRSHYNVNTLVFLWFYPQVQFLIEVMMKFFF